MPFCNSCGTNIESGAQFCPKCGKPAGAGGPVAATGGATSPGASPQGNNAVKIILIVVAVIVGLGVLGTIAATVIGYSGDICRFPSAGHFARYNATAPIEASSGPKIRHRLTPAKRL